MNLLPYESENQTSLTGRAVKVAGGEADLSSMTIGLDLGDKKHAYCVLEAYGKVLKKESITNDRAALKQLTSEWPEALMVMEAGTHSPWISRFFKEAGNRHRGQSAQGQGHLQKPNARAMTGMELLARIARWMRRCCIRVEHGGEKQQRDLLGTKLRDALVRARVGLINAGALHPQESGL